METESGLRFVYEHYRYDRIIFPELSRYHPGDSTWKPAEKGGVTICHIFDQEGAVLAERQAHCSRKDSFCYRIGREIARGRALKALQTSS